jgi:uncharacterized protein YheU (UPF0270 family)
VSEPSGIEIPYTALSDAALHGVIAEFVTRPGTDYGLVEKTLEEKIADVRHLLARGEAKIVYDPATETADIVPAERR